MRNNSVWNNELKEHLRVLYPIIPNSCLSAYFDVSVKSIERQARIMHLRKAKKEQYRPIPHGTRKRFDVSKEKIIRLRQLGLTVRETCEELGIAIDTYYRYIRESNKFQQE